MIAIWLSLAQQNLPACHLAEAAIIGGFIPAREVTGVTVINRSFGDCPWRHKAIRET
jgi:hypothetical protein